MISTVDFCEVVTPPKYPSKELEEQFRVQKEHNYSVRQIMERYAAGITNNSAFNGVAMLPGDPGSIDPRLYDEILDAPDIMSANRVDRNDYEDFYQEAAKANNPTVGTRFSTTQQSAEVSQETMTPQESVSPTE